MTTGSLYARMRTHGTLSEPKEDIYLAYGKSVPRTLDGFIADLRVVLAAFSGMAAAYCAARVGREEWDWFVGDLAERGAISISAADVWSR